MKKWQEILLTVLGLYFIIRIFSKEALEAWKSIGKGILIIIAPLLLILMIEIIFMVIFSIGFWQLPDNYYFPFITGGKMQGMFDRTMLLLGIFILLITKHDNPDIC